jgi:tetraacyldisaccharide 4'-kinase
MAPVADAHGPLPTWLAPVTWPMARLYGVGVAWRNARFDRCVGVQRLAGVPVISVGNLTAGGTGKSPFVAWCARMLGERGAQPVIAMRGYRAQGADAAATSDEAREYAHTAPQAQLVVGPRRFEALSRAFQGWRAEPAFARAMVILDDGFQHRQLARALDIVLVDASRPGLDGDLLPNGWLREPARNIARADLVVVTKAHDAEALARTVALVERVRGRAPDAVCDHAWSALAVHEQGAERTERVEWLAGKRVLSACALGNPGHFHAMVERASGVAPATIERRDHAAMRADELESAAARAGAAAVIVSRKDFVKLDRPPRLALAVPELGVRFLSGESRVVDAILDALTDAATRRSASTSDSR